MGLKHRYFVLRHGHSVPNARGIICSSMANGCRPEFGLSPQGKEQASDVGAELASRFGADTAVVFLVSPFTRAQETARAAAAAFRHARSETHADLRERHFGDLELKSDSHYSAAWAEDKAQLPVSPLGVEHVSSVWRRVQAVVDHAEKRFPEPTLVFLVAHGDTLQITQCGFAGKALSEHRSLPHLNQAGWREVTPLSSKL